jgi:hypothetical protein
MIEESLNIDEKFIGLGSKEEQIGFSEGHGYEWYEKRYNVSKLSLYDQLAICNMLTPDCPHQKEWYEDIVAKNPSNYKAVYGLALTEHNNDSIKRAL